MNDQSRPTLKQNLGEKLEKAGVASRYGNLSPKQLGFGVDIPVALLPKREEVQKSPEVGDKNNEGGDKPTANAQEATTMNENQTFVAAAPSISANGTVKVQEQASPQPPPKPPTKEELDYWLTLHRYERVREGKPVETIKVQHTVDPVEGMILGGAVGGGLAIASLVVWGIEELYKLATK